MTLLDTPSCYAAIKARDARYDGRFFTGVHSTQIYCRPTCPAKPPLLKNIRFYRTAAEAEEKGLRPCKRCRPEAATHSSAGLGTQSTVSRAFRLIQGGYLHPSSGDSKIETLASALGVGERQLRNLFSKHLGTSPLAIELNQRLNLAHTLLLHPTPSRYSSRLSITDIAFQSGFSSIRRFNDAFKRRYGMNPSQLRQLQKKKISLSKRLPSKTPPSLTLELSYRSPFHWETLLDFFRQRAVAGMEWVDSNRYARTYTLPQSSGKASGWIEIKNQPASNQLSIDIYSAPSSPSAPPIFEILNRVRRMFDLAADPLSIQKDLSQCSGLKRILKKYPGMRVPGTWEGYEIAIRAIIGQLITVKAASTLLSRLVEHYGEITSSSNPHLHRLFPSPQKLLHSRLEKIGLPRTKASAIQEICKIQIADPQFFNTIVNPDFFRRRLLEIKGIGKWTVDYILLRLSETDSLPSTDLVIHKQLEKETDPHLIKNCKPWGSYAALYLWRKHAESEK